MKDIFETSDCLDFDQIKLYVQGKLNSKKRYKLEEHLTDCELCSDALDGYISSDSMKEAEAFLDNTTWPAKQQTENPIQAKVIPLNNKPSRVASLLKIAAMLVGLISSVVVLSYVMGGNSHYDELIASSTPIYDASNRNDSAAVSAEPFYKALQLFDNKQYTESAELFKEHLVVHPKDKAAVFFQGLAFLKSGKTNQAIEQLEQIYLDRASGYSLDATWFLALAKLKKGNKKRAKSLLTTLAETGNYYNKKASDLLIVLE